MLQTTNYKFNKLELDDSPADITHLNPNWDKIDTELKRGVDALELTNKNLANSDKLFAEHVSSHLKSHVVSQRTRNANDPDYGI